MYNPMKEHRPQVDNNRNSLQSILLHSLERILSFPRKAVRPEFYCDKELNLVVAFSQ